MKKKTYDQKPLKNMIKDQQQKAKEKTKNTQFYKLIQEMKHDERFTILMCNNYY